MGTTSLQGRRIVITGAGRGIGLATAKELHTRGATVIIGDVDERSALAAAKSIGSNAEGYAVDVSGYDSFAAFHQKATANGIIDVLINNAGIMPIGRFLDQSADTHRRAVQINVLGAINGMHLTLPAMVARGSGHIINVASTAGKTPVPGGLTYCGTKSAVIAITETARVEYKGSGIDFTCVMPSFTNTELIAGTTATKLIPVVEPEDVARAIADAIERPKPDVFVPRIVGPLLWPQPLLGRRIRDLFNHSLGADRSFLDFDPKARSGYDKRIGK
ncbi:SDR family oxidoreductase [Hoyosella subflava]|uniref:Short-chain dehydrogenase/reductase family oxidoreductase n=1 Tax=Hoyosella subflava (strain DSM 45089 / JCM 17490 / NBRC 109087 / DQS3-9A1) TaxID=443218 RepID=F6ER23_HOYSD|nr:SDR family oxidoreductase [Hoyosella subflava]AEF40710.1 Short-chain dehydrogenase/reductase family oxidoreductase [Hoyosella subflava DQS3-9A1]